MSALDDLQSATQNAREGLDSSLAAAELGQQTDDLAQQFAALGNEGSAQVLAQNASPRLATVREYLANAQQELDGFVQDCEQAKGTRLPRQPGGSSSNSTSSSGGTTSAPTGWFAPGIAEDVRRPSPEKLHLPAERRAHMLDGDPGGPGGGHRYGTTTR